MVDLLRFYHYFGLRLTDDASQKLYPDHIVCQLEMLSHLCELESRANGQDELALGYRRAQRDFIGRHIKPWWPSVVQALDRLRTEDQAVGWYAAVAEFTQRGVEIHFADELATT